MMDVKRIMQLIPHRYPFLLVDRVLELEPGKRAVGLKNVTINEHFFSGHFPTDPVMPGVLIIEAFAQTAAVLVVESLGKEFEGRLVYFTSIESAKFRKPVVPGDAIKLHVEIVKHRGLLYKLDCYGEVDGERVAEATIAALIRDEK